MEHSTASYLLIGVLRKDRGGAKEVIQKVETKKLEVKKAQEEPHFANINGDEVQTGQGRLLERGFSIQMPGEEPPFTVSIILKRNKNDKYYDTIQS